MAILFETQLDVSEFLDGLKKMEKGGKKVEGSLVGSFDSMAKGIGASMAAAFSVGAVVGAAKSLLDFGGQLADQAEALGVNTEVLQGFQGAMAGSGVSAEKFTKGMATLISSIQQAKEGSGTARDSFAALGIEFDSIANDSPDQILLKIADGLKNATDPAAAYAAALKLVGQNQINFVSALKGGSAAFAENASKIKVLSDEEVKAIDDIGNAWDTAVLKAKAYAAQALLALAKPKGIEEQAGTSTVYNPMIQGGAMMGRPSSYTPPEEKPEYFGPENPTKYNAEGIEIFANTTGDPVEAKKMSDLADLQAKLAMDNLTNERVNAEKVADHQADLDAERTAKKKQDLKEFYEEEEEYERQKQLDIAAYEKKKSDEKKKEAGQANVELAAKTLEMAQQDTALAQQKTNDARTSLRNALMGNPDPKETSQQKQVNRLMKRAESPKVEKEGLKIGKVGGKGVLDKKPPEALSTKRGAGKALKELNDAKRAEKDAKEQEELAKEQQKDMVTALKAIEKGINGN